MKCKLSPEVRLRQYENCKKYISKRKGYVGYAGFCGGLSWPLMNEYFPELWKRKPVHVLVSDGSSFWNKRNPQNPHHWFDPKDYDKRLKILDDCIAEVTLLLPELSPETRIAQYKIAINYIERKKNWGMSAGFCNALNVHFSQKNFPELWAKRPKNVSYTRKHRFERRTGAKRTGISNYWWDSLNHDKRLTTLNECIEQVNVIIRELQYE